jgi:daunorubicin resistance ABC transporter ATP-binding subunit
VTAAPPVGAPIRVSGLRKVYRSARGEVVAVDGIDLAVASGEFFGLLGPNGAGKSTTIGMLTTRIAPTSGSAYVAGLDVTTDPGAVKQQLGVVPQTNTLDRALSVRDNLVFHGRYFGMRGRDARNRSDELLERFQLVERSASMVQTLSGGMAQRLMFARALMHRPEVLVLDEPTSGIDPQTRINLWQILRELHQAGQTILLTTHYMEEADTLCDRLAIIDHGQMLTSGTPAELKAALDAESVITVTFDAPAAAAAPDVERLGNVVRVEADGDTLRVFAHEPSGLVGAVATVAAGHDLGLRDASVAPPTLEAVFLALTGRAYRE